MTTLSFLLGQGNYETLICFVVLSSREFRISASQKFLLQIRQKSFTHIEQIVLWLCKTAKHIARCNPIIEAIYKRVYV